MRREILIEKDVLNVLRDALGVELWLFYCKIKNFGPNVIYYVSKQSKQNCYQQVFIRKISSFLCFVLVLSLFTLAI